MMMRNAFILANCTTNTVPNFYSFDYKMIMYFAVGVNCLIIRHWRQIIRQF